MRPFLFLTLSLTVFVRLSLAQETRPPVPIDFPASGGFLPDPWTRAPIDAEVTPLEIGLQARAAAIITKGLQKYPEPLVKQFLGGVSIVGSLRFYHVSYGGTYMSEARKVVLAYKRKFDSRGFEQRLHHEFSSLLLKMNQKSFSKRRWSAANPPGFTYRAGGVIEEQHGDRSEATKVLGAEQKKTGGSGSSLLRVSPALMEEGFLTPYNRISVEQDVNEMAAHLFTDPEIWKFCEDYPRIDQKVDVLIDFYRTLNPTMDRLYFRNLTSVKKVAPL